MPTSSPCYLSTARWILQLREQNHPLAKSIGSACQSERLSDNLKCFVPWKQQIGYFTSILFGCLKSAHSPESFLQTFVLWMWRPGSDHSFRTPHELSSQSPWAVYTKHYSYTQNDKKITSIYTAMVECGILFNQFDVHAYWFLLGCTKLGSDLWNIEQSGHSDSTVQRHDFENDDILYAQICWRLSSSILFFQVNWNYGS